MKYYSFQRPIVPGNYPRKDLVKENQQGLLYIHMWNLKSARIEKIEQLM